MKRTTFIGGSLFLERLIISVLVVGTVAFLGFIFWPMFAPGPASGRPPSCLSQVKQLALATLMYANDYDERLPDRDRWMDQITEYHKNRMLEHCPGLPEQRKEMNWTIFGYAFNSHLSRRDSGKIKKPEAVPMIYDSINMGRSASDPFNSLPIPGRHKGKDNVGFLDGHVKAVEPPAPKNQEGS